MPNARGLYGSVLMIQRGPSSALRYIQQQERTQEDKSTSTDLVRRSKPSSGEGEHTRRTQLQDYNQTYQVRQSQSAILGAVSSAVADTKMAYWKEEDTMYVPM